MSRLKIERDMLLYVLKMNINILSSYKNIQQLSTLTEYNSATIKLIDSWKKENKESSILGFSVAGEGHN